MTMKKTIIHTVAAFSLAASATVQAGLEPGSVVIYSNGNVEKLLEQNTQWSLWEDQRKRQYKRSYLPYLPVLEYLRFSDTPSGYRQSVDNLQALEMVPFAKRESIRFSVRRHDLKKGNRSRHWQCHYDGKGRFKLRGKRYATQKYKCERFTLNKWYQASKKEEVAFYYSPTLDLVLKKIRINSRGEKSRVEVARIYSPEKATAKRISRQIYRLKKEG